jgi:hypothetical protein
VQAFDRETPVLVTGEHRDNLGGEWLLWPALQYRVVTPVVDHPALNVFQRGLLNLARAGMHELAEIAELLGLHPEFAKLVADELLTVGHLDESMTPTSKGLAVLEDGFLDPRRSIVTHVYLDVFTGQLWPASVPAPHYAAVRWRGKERADVQLATLAESRQISALVIGCGEAASSEAPDNDCVIEAVSRGTRVGVLGEPGSVWNQRAPDRVASRVSLLNAGEPVYLPVALTRERPKRGEETAVTTWLAFTPFSRKASALLRRLVSMRMETNTELRRVVTKLVGHPSSAGLAELDRMQEQVQSQWRELLIAQFGERLRANRDLFEQLIVAEHNWRLAKLPGERSIELGSTVHFSWKVQEIVLRDIVEAHRSLWERLFSEGPANPPNLRLACKRIGLNDTEHLKLAPLKFDRKLLARITQLPQDIKVNELLSFAVLSASASEADHPFRRLAAGRRDLLTAMTEASRQRHDAAHGHIAVVDTEFAALARRLAFETVAAHLGVPVPDEAR